MTQASDHSNYRSENAVLLAAARGTAIASEAVAALNWDYLLAAAGRQGMIPLLQRWVTEHRLPIPPETAATLSATYWTNHFRTRALLAELAAIRAAAVAVGIPLLPLKGAALAPTVYPAPELRPMSDLDLLTHADDLPRIHAVFADLGYVEEPYEASLLPTRLRDPLRREWKFVASRGGFPILVEVRAEPLDPGLPPLTELDHAFSARLHTHATCMWNRARPLNDDAAAMLHAAPEDLMLHVASHMATRHADFRLIWLLDIRQIIAHAPEFDWDYLAGEAQALGLAVPVHAALDAATRWLDVPLPALWHKATAPLAPRLRHPVDALEWAVLAPREQTLATTDLAAIPPTPAWLAAVSIARVSWQARARALRWLLLPCRSYLAGWRNSPQDTTNRRYAGTAAFRLLVSLLMGMAAIARGLRLPIFPALVDRLMQRLNPFGKYKSIP